MKVYIADLLSNTVNGKTTGHYFAVAHNYSEIFKEECVVAGGPIYQDAFDSSNLFVLPYNCSDEEKGLRIRLKTLINARELFKVAKGEIIVLQQCSTITTFLCLLFFYHRKSRLFLIQYNLQGIRNSIGKLFLKFVKRKIDGIICPNDEVGKAYNINYCVVPDYIYTGNQNVKNVQYTDKIYDFCIIGRISEEKGVIELASHLANTSYRILIAGRPQTEDLGNKLKVICRRANNIELDLGFITYEKYQYYLDNSRYALLNYKGEYSKRSSGVVYDTLFSGLPVVGCRCKALQFIEDFDMGYLYSDLNSFNPDTVLNKESFEMFQNNIKSYRLTHKDYKYKLRKFLFNL